MITPTGVTPSAYWSAIKAGNPTHIRMTFLGQNIVLEDEDIEITAGLTVYDIINGDTDLVFGKALSKQISTVIINTDKLNGLIWTGEFQFEMGVEIGNATNWVTLGYFSGEKPNNITSVHTIAFTAYDRMVLFDQIADDFVNSITYPITLQGIYNGLCAFVGLQNTAGDELPLIMSRSFSSAPSDIIGYTCRDILAWIAEACGCYATIDETGKVKMVWFTDNTGHAITGNEEFDVESADVNDGMIWNVADTYTWDDFDQFTWNDVCGFREEYAIDRIVVKQFDGNMDVNYPEVITDGNTYLISENPFLKIGSNTELQNYIVPLYNRLILFGGYLPVNISCVGNWCVEAGDIVTIDVNNYTLAIPIFVKTMYWNGAINDSYETTGNKVRETYTSAAQKQQILNNREIRLFVEGNYYGIKSGIAITDSGVIITGGKAVRIESGGTFDVDSTNFKISSIDKYMQTGYWKFDEKGAHCTEPDLPAEFQLGNLANRVANASGVFYSISNSGGKASRLVLYTGGYNTAADTYYNCGLNIFGAYNNGHPRITMYARSGATFRIGQLLNSLEDIWCNEYFGKQWTNLYSAQTFRFHPIIDATNINLGQPDARVDFERGWTDNTYTRQYIKIRAADDFSHDMIFEGKLSGYVSCDSTSVTDFNNLTTPGHYHVSLSAMSHRPSDLSSGSVEVEVTAISSTYFMQRIYTGSNIYTRYIYNGTASSWYRFTGVAV